MSAFIAYQPPQPPAAPSGINNLHVSPDGSQINTNVPGGQLQPAAPPQNSTTSSDANQQQATPNYCEPGEVPIADGCVAQNP